MISGHELLEYIEENHDNMMQLAKSLKGEKEKDYRAFYLFLVKASKKEQLSKSDIKRLSRDFKIEPNMINTGINQTTNKGGSNYIGNFGENKELIETIHKLELKIAELKAENKGLNELVKTLKDVIGKFKD